MGLGLLFPIGAVGLLIAFVALYRNIRKLPSQLDVASKVRVWLVIVIAAGYIILSAVTQFFIPQFATPAYGGPWEGIVMAAGYWPIKIIFLPFSFFEN